MSKKKAFNPWGKTHEELVDQTIIQIKSDIHKGDTTAIAELLKNLSTVDLVNYLPQ